MTVHEKIAVDLYNQGYNCSQAVFCAFCDVTGLERDEAFRISSSFGGGMGRLGEVCGALSGAFMATGMLLSGTDEKDKAAKDEHYLRVKQLGEQFRMSKGSLLCRDLLEINKNRMEETRDGVKVKECEHLVAVAAKMLDEYLEELKG
ncbi:MAG: C-GCAxxG-C-C family protein [Erysipelotrichaceae bacterium]|nr:C-GCAxxG-C-C family protein [Erysipelotrichaceae bacterium]